MRKFSAPLALLILAACSGGDPVDQPEAQAATATPSPAEGEELPTMEIEVPEDFGEKFEPARAAIDDYCGDDAVCDREQRESLGRFVKIMAGFDDPNSAVAGRCMRAGKIDQGIDWTIATPCMQAAARGKPLGARLN